MIGEPWDYCCQAKAQAARFKLERALVLVAVPLLVQLALGFVVAVLFSSPDDRNRLLYLTTTILSVGMLPYFSVLLLVKYVRNLPARYVACFGIATPWIAFLTVGRQLFGYYPDNHMTNADSYWGMYCFVMPPLLVLSIATYRLLLKKVTLYPEQIDELNRIQSHGQEAAPEEQDASVEATTGTMSVAEQIQPVLSVTEMPDSGATPTADSGIVIEIRQKSLDPVI